MWPPISSARSLSPWSVDHRFPAASTCVSTGSSASLDRSQARVSTHVRVKATRCAPFSSAVRARSSLSSATVRFGSKGGFIDFLN